MKWMYLCNFKLCRWNQVFSKKYDVHVQGNRHNRQSKCVYYDDVSVINSYSAWQHEQAQRVDINFERPKHGMESLAKAQSPAKQPKLSLPTCTEQQCFIETLQNLSPQSAVLSVTALRHGPQVNTSVARLLPPTVMSLRNRCYTHLTRKELQDKCEEIYISSWPESLFTGI